MKRSNVRFGGSVEALFRMVVFRKFAAFVNGVAVPLPKVAKPIVALLR